MSAPANAVLLMDRFVSASSAQDAMESLQGMLEGFKDKEEPWQSSWIWQHDELPEHLIHLLQNGNLKTDNLPCDDGPNAVCQLYQHLAKDKESLQKPGSGRLLEGLLDVMDNSELPMYTRVLSLQVLELISEQHSSIAGIQWLEAPNGLHRLADLLLLGVDNPMEEVVRNQALNVAQLLAKEAPMAKVFLFAEVECKLLDLCWQEGGLTKGNAIVLDALALIQELLKHADASLQDLVWQRPNVGPRLAQLLDLRGGDEFLHPPEQKPKSKKIKDEEDDLDSLLQSGETTKSKRKDGESKLEEEENRFVPHLSKGEEEIVFNVIDILHLLLESESLRPTVWKQHAGLCSLAWELALISPVHPAVCAIPSAKLQQAALELVAQKLCDPSTMDKHHGLDRLLYLVCTGGGTAMNHDERMGISQAAVAVLRRTLTTDRIHELLMNTLAPPPVQDEMAPPPGLPVVKKLWNTVAENLVEDEQNPIDPGRRTLFLSGALGGLSLMLCDEQSRMMLYKVTPPTASIEQMLGTLATETENVQWTLLRFLCEWVRDTPFMVQSLLSSTASLNLTSMAVDRKPQTPLVHLLLGLAMESLGNEEDCGGWTRAGILQLIQKIDLSKYIASLEGLKEVDLMPWAVCSLEHQHWKAWYQKAVWVVRKRVVEELAGTSGGVSDEESDEGETEKLSNTRAFSGGSLKALQKMIAQQAKEMDDLRQELEHAQAKITLQEHQLGTWKRRMESTPTELDGMLNEFTVKTAALEASLSKMQADAKVEKAKHQSEVKERDEQLEQQREEAERLRSIEQEAREDRERMEQELQGLSQAYASLEDEFRRQNEPSVATDAPTAEESQPHQPEEETFQRRRSSSGSTEVATLRAENARLRNDARAADEWMAMAVQRMNDMGSSNSTLEHQVASLQNQIQDLQTQATNSQLVQEEIQQQAFEIQKDEMQKKLASLQSVLKEEQSLREDAEVKLSNLGIELNTQLESERQNSMKLNSQLMTLQEEMRVDMDRNQLEKEGLERRLEEMRTQLSEAPAATNQSPLEGNDERVNKLQAELDAIVTSTNAEILSLTTSLEKARQQQLQADPSEHPPSTRPSDNDEMSPEQVETARNEINELKRRSQEEIYKKESIIRELENRLNSGQGGYKFEDIRIRDEEIEELRTANEAAQEWMSKAMEHHQMLSLQVSTLSEEKTALSTQLNEISGQLVPSNVNEAAAKDLESELNIMSNKMEEVRQQLAQKDEELKGLKAQMNESQTMQQELGITRDDMTIMQQELAKSQQHVQVLESRLAENTLSEENEKLRNSNDQLEKQAEEFQAWSDVAQKKIAEILSAKEVVDKLLEEANVKLETRKSDIEAVAMELEEKSSALEKEIETRMSIAAERDQLALEIESLQSRLSVPTSMSTVTSAEGQSDESLGQLKAELGSLEATNQSLSADFENQGQELSELKENYGELQAWAETAQTKALELIAAKENLEALLEVEKKKVMRLEEDIAGSKEETEYVATKSDVDTTAINKLVQPAVSAKNDAAQLFGSGEAIPLSEEETSPTVEYLQQQLSEKEEELKLAQATLTADEDAVHRWEERVAELETEVLSLQQQMEDQEESANTAITEWQESHTESERRCSSLEEQLEAVKKEKELVENSLGDLKGELNAAHEIQGRDSAVIQQMEERAMELEAAVKSFESQLAEQGQEANGVISQWQDSYTALEEKCSDLESKIHALEEEKETMAIEIKDVGDEGIIEKLRLVEEELKAAQETLAHDEDIVDQWEATVAELQTEVTSLESQLKEQEIDANNVIEQWQESCSLSEDKCAELEKQLESMNQEKTNIEKALEYIQINNEELVAERLVLESKISSLEKAAKTERSPESEAASRLKEKEQELRDALETIARDEEVVQQWEERVSELETNIKEFETQLQDQEKEANKVISEWQETCFALEEKVSNAEEELTSNSEKLADRDGKIKKLQAEVESFRVQVVEFKASADAAATLKADISRLNKDRESERLPKVEGDANYERLEAELVDERQRHAEARDEIEVLSKAIEDIRSESEDVVNQWSARAEELEATIKELKDHLEQQEQEANEAIASWETKAEELEKELDAVEPELQDLRKEAERVEGLQDRIVELEDKIEQQKFTMEFFDVERNKSQERISLLEEQLSDLKIHCDEISISKKESHPELEALQDKLRKLVESEESLKKELGEMEKELEMTKQDREKLKETVTSKSKEKLEERDRLTVVVAQLEEELREANDMIQKHITDGSSEKATEMAAQALRDEIEELKRQVAVSRQTADEETIGRKTAELEIDCLRDDVAALLALVDDENTSDEIQLRTTKAAEKLKKKERGEIEQLRTSLYRAIDELEIARVGEKEANEKLSKLRLQTAVCEQEIIAAKSEINFLTQTMEEMRLAEASKAASLEYRVGSLEDENDVLRKYHARDLESMRNDLAQVMMEKDRVLHQLKESEKKNSALLFAASKGDSDSDQIVDFEAELARLRVENAHLLTVAADDKTRAERRLREVLAAHSASTEADTILEHELRIAAEATIKTLKAELEELKNEERKSSRSQDNEISKGDLSSGGSLTEESDALKHDLKKLKTENETLKSMMAAAASAAKSEIEALTEDCRNAQAKAHKLEREGKFNDAVKSEVSKFRLSPTNSTPETRVTSNDGWMLVSNDSVSTDRQEAALSSAEAFDLIRKQKEEIQEERRMYLEFLGEHDDLLALLAQQDLERACLKEALCKAGHEDAITEAVQRAEQKAIEEFGKIIRVS